MIPNYRLYDKENEEMEYFEDYREVSDMFSALDEDDGVYEEPMQSTGLKDKDGVEIYEGDLVDFNGLHEIRFGIHGVPSVETEEYIDTVTGFYFKPQHDLKKIIPFSLDIPLNDRYAAKSVVVGNIYQNANLLEADNHE